MRLRPLFLASLLAAVAAPVMAQGYDYARSGYDNEQGREIRSAADFEAPLARFGRWVPSRWGRAWTPNVGRDWRPYTAGEWVDGPDGREWRSDEPWGWATYHYGRWGFDDRWGWVWVPGTEWAPAWVAFRDGDDYTGWAPIPPQYDYDSINAWDYSRWYAPSWVYVPRARFYGTRVGSYALPWRYNRNYWDRTRHSEHRWDGRGRQDDRDRRPGDDRGRPGWDRGDRSHDSGRPNYGQRPGAPAGNTGVVSPGFDNRGDRSGHDRRPNRSDARSGQPVNPPPVILRPDLTPPPQPEAVRQGGGWRGRPQVNGQPVGRRPPDGDGGNRGGYRTGGDRPAYQPSVTRAAPAPAPPAPRPAPAVQAPPPAAAPAPVPRPERPAGNDRPRHEGRPERHDGKLPE